MAAKKKTATRLIRRYGGNRLYDLEAGSYLTPDDIRRLELNGIQIAVRDAATGQDVTDEVVSTGSSH